MSDPMATRSDNGSGHDALQSPVSSDTSRRATWSQPRVDELPRLNELTLQTGGGIPGGGGTGGGGSTVF
jgi:hypothetical protein